jgi:hypothetical protein
MIRFILGIFLIILSRRVYEIGEYLKQAGARSRRIPEINGYPKQVSTRNGQIPEIGGYEKQAGTRKDTRNKQIKDKD